MKPHFGQSDAAMNKLAGCNSFPNASKGLEMIAELEDKAREAGYDTPLEYLRATHEEAVGMGLEPEFFERLKVQPMKNRTEHMTPEPLPKGYYGHELGCDCAVCEDIHMSELANQRVDAEWNKLLDGYKDATLRIAELEAEVAQVTQSAINFHEVWGKYRDALHIIAHMGISGLSWQHDYEKCVNIAKEALEI